MSASEGERDWPATYAALGRVIVEAGRLEFRLSTALIDRTDPLPPKREDADEQAIRKRVEAMQVGRVIDYLKDALTKTGGLIDGVADYLTECREVLNARNDLVHAHWQEGGVWVATPDGPREIAVAPINYSRRARVMARPTDIDALADALHDVERRGVDLFVLGVPPEQSWREPRWKAPGPGPVPPGLRNTAAPKRRPPRRRPAGTDAPPITNLPHVWSRP